jgi:Protein of unknown function (DUF1344)
MVKNIISALMIVGAMGAGTATFASPGMGENQAVGYITDVDLVDREITLTDGTTFQLPFGFDVNTLNEGQKIQLSWDEMGGERQAQSLSFTN